MRSRWLLRAIAFLVLAGAAGWAYWTNVGNAKPAMDMSMRVTSGATPFPVTVAGVERGPIAGTVTYTGSVAAENEQDVFARVPGRIVDMSVYPGDAVREGQVLARLDDVELGSRVSEARAAVTAADANVAQMDADITAARHGVTQMARELEMAQADAEHQEHLIVRDERLYAMGAIALQDLEATRAAVTGARAKVAAARARLEQARAMETVAGRKREAMLAMAGQSRAMQRTAEVVRGYVEIRSPGNGFVVKRLAAPGVLVQPGMPIFKIAAIGRVRLQANVAERDLPSIRTGSAVRVTTTGAAPTTARVTSVFPFIDAGARTGVVEALVDNHDRRFLPGQYVTMEFVTGEHAAALTVPRAAVARLGGTATAWVVLDGRVERREVVTGLETEDRVQIVRGLDAGARVVARGHEGLYAGARVAEVNSPTPPSAGAGPSSQGPVPPPAKPETPARPKEGGHAGH